MSAASLASYVYSKFSGSGALTPGGSSDMKNLSRSSSPNPKLTAVWRTKPQKSEDVPNSSPTFKEDGSLLRLLRTKSMPSLVLDKGSPIRQTAPVVMPFSPNAKNDTSLDHSTSSSLASPITSRHVNPRRNLEESYCLESSTNTSITTPPPSPRGFTISHVKLTRSVSDGHIIRRRKQQLRSKTLDFPTGGMPSVKTLRLKFDAEKQIDSYDSSRSMAYQGSYSRVNKEKQMSGDKIENKNGEPPMTILNKSGHKTPGEPTQNKKLVRHESLRRFEPQHNEVEPKEREVHIQSRSVKSLLKQFEITVHSSKDDETAHTSQRQSRPPKRVVKLKPSPELQSSLESDQENEPETKITNGDLGKVVLRQRSKSLPAPSENKRSSLANIPANVQKLKMHFESQSGPVEVQPSKEKLRETDKSTSNLHEQTKPEISGNLAKREDGYESSAKAKGELKKQVSIGKVNGTTEQEDECHTQHPDKQNQANEQKVPKSPSVKNLRKHFEAPTSPQLSRKDVKERPVRRRHTIASPAQQEFIAIKTPDQKLPQTTHVKDAETDDHRHPHASVKNLLRQFESQHSKERASEEMPERVIIKGESLTSSYVRVKPVSREESLVMTNTSDGPTELKDDDSDEEFYYESGISLKLKVQGSVDYNREDSPEGNTRRGVLQRNFARTESSSSEHSGGDEQIFTRIENDNWRAKKLQEQSDRDLTEQEKRKWEQAEREAMELHKLEEMTLQRERERTALMQAEEEKGERERIQQEEEQRRQMQEKADNERLAREKADDERREREKLQQKERERAEEERRERERAEQERKERERLEQVDRERAQREQEERERLELEKRKQEKEEFERREQERREHEERERREYEERERAKQEQREREQMELERENQKKELERKEKERAEQEEKERERVAQERREREKAELERKELERQEKEKAEIKRREQEKNQQLERESRERKQAEREILEREKAEKEDQEMTVNKKAERGHKKREEEEEEKQNAIQMERDKEMAEKARLQRGQETEELMKRHKVGKLVDKFTTLQVPESETKVKGDGSSEALKENFGEGRRELDVSVLIERFANAKKRSSSASSHSSEEDPSSKQSKETTAPIPTVPAASAKNVPGKVRNLNADELRFFNQDGAAFEPFVRSQSLRAKKDEPPPFQQRGGSLRVKGSEPRPLSGDDKAMPNSCRKLRPDELRFFAMTNNNIYAAKKLANKPSQRPQDFRLGSQDDPRNLPTMSPGDDQGHSDDSDSDSDTSLLRDYDRDDESTDEALLLPVEHLDLSATPYHDDDDDDEAHCSSLTTMDSVIQDISTREFPMNFHLSKQSVRELEYLGSLSHDEQMHFLEGEDDSKHNVSDDNQLHKLISEGSVYGNVCEIIHSDIKLSCSDPKTSTPINTLMNTARTGYGDENSLTAKDSSSAKGNTKNDTGILEEAGLDIQEDHQQSRQRPLLSKFPQDVHRNVNQSRTSAESIPSSELPEGLQDVLQSIGVMASPTDAEDLSMATAGAFDQDITPKWTNDESLEGINTKPIEDYFLHIDESKEYLSDREFAVFCILVALLSVIIYFIYDFLF